MKKHIKRSEVTKLKYKTFAKLELVKFLVEILCGPISSLLFFSSSCCIYFILAFIHPFYSGNNNVNFSKAFDPPEVLFTVQEHRCKPSLGHGAIPVTFDILLAIPDRRKHALYGVC